MAKAKRCVRSSKATLRPANRPPPPTSRGTAAASNPCHIGIDIGSHRTRIAIWADGTEIVVENKHSFSLEHYPGDFPSALYVFDKDGSPSADDIYLVDREDPNRLSVSAKYVFYALADASDTLLEQYPLLHHLMTKKKDPSFKDRLRRGMIQLLTVLRDRAMAVCKARNWHVRKIGLTIPVQWTLEFEEVYCGLVSEVFQIDPGVVYFFTETEALARYLFKHHGAQIDPNEQHNAVMFYDYGGHNMVSYHLTARVSCLIWFLERLRLRGCPRRRESRAAQFLSGWKNIRWGA
ncbi:hypothetical protein B0T16DRAFT_137007 [Cercophora newfieldiana]|uniref:Uncharacterized protein n=1 Tax=Cercophora newfieldiana TaxID=92897 RepID=A0AA39YBZ1_9PEZI|nr:hypothetical protein B0T16DRAFT_137007 [Cercophora newfieldiana]